MDREEVADRFSEFIDQTRRLISKAERAAPACSKEFASVFDYDSIQATALQFSAVLKTNLSQITNSDLVSAVKPPCRVSNGAFSDAEGGDPELLIALNRVDHILQPGWYTTVGSKGITFSVGIFDVIGSALHQYRMLVQEQGDELAAAIERSGARIRTHPTRKTLKGLPRLFRRSGEHAQFLRRRDLVVSLDMHLERLPYGVVAGIVDAATQLLPVWDILTSEPQARGAVPS